jgi:hypothetical protein
MADLPIIPVDLPVGWCPASEQERLNKFAESRVSIDTSNFSVIITGASTPSAAQRTYLWKKPNDGRIYEWNASVGAWVAEHLWQAAASPRFWWPLSNGAILTTFDGGDSGTLGDVSGPMWVEDTDFGGKFPLAVGTLTSGAAVTLGSTGGNDQHTNTIAEMPVHDHAMTNVDNTTNTLAAGSGTGGGIVIPREIAARTGETGSGTAYSILPPYKTGYWIKRSARRYYKGN